MGHFNLYNSAHQSNPIGFDVLWGTSSNTNGWEQFQYFTSEVGSEIIKPVFVVVHHANISLYLPIYMFIFDVNI